MFQSLDVQFSKVLANGDDCILIELDDDILKTIEEGSLISPPELYIKGHEDEEAVLCTSSQTFLVKKVSTSNLLLLSKILDEKMNIVASLDCHLELQKIKTGSGDLRKKLLNYKQYEGYVDTYELGASYEDLLEWFTGSEKELLENLKFIRAFSLNNNRWTMIHRKYVKQLLCFIISSLEAEGRPLQDIPRAVISRLIKEYGSLEIIENWILENFFIKTEQEEKYTMSNLDVVKFFAEHILENNKSKGIELDTFMEEWNKSMNGGLYVDIDMLKV